MDKVRKMELIQRSLGIRHKLKVHESMKHPDNHEDLALMMISKWELEDELRAIEEMLAESRQKNIAAKKTYIEKEGPHVKLAGRAADEVATAPPRKKKK